MAPRNSAKGPRFVKFIIPVTNALMKLDGSGRPREIKDIIAEDMGISDKELNESISSGQSRFSKNVDWARFYLAKAGYIDSSMRGVWSLTEKGRKSHLTNEDALEIFRSVHQDFVTTRRKGSQTTPTEANLEENSRILNGFGPNNPEAIDHRKEIMEIIQSLPSEGFERLCQRLLRESGFEKVSVTGRSGDGGLDGIGVLQVNPFVSFTVLFQSKRYSGSVTAGQVRDFRGAMSGRTDKGIIITTGSFTADAKREATREGVAPIELVDGEKLIDLFENLELGLKPKKAFDVDRSFFSEYR